MSGPPPPSAVVLLSGGIDSATAAAIARAEGRALLALTLRYGQRHAVEVEAARAIARSLRVLEHLVLDLRLDGFGGSALTGGSSVPKDRPLDEIGRGIPPTYVPARNAIFLSLAAALAESRGAGEIFFGANVLDWSGYPDCRPEFLEAMERALSLGTRAGMEGSPIRLRAPLLRMTKAEIVRKGTALGLDYALTHSCYDPGTSGAACGGCDACLLRRKGFEEARLPDPTRYRTR
ncbi:MAG: 7-cyano-7-deazaguanine synthase QueC [Planctomycetes bacterium]|nr:7-cyano-7-deazaguanine synthase QueC [Planctomycetota bacterium]